MAKTVTFTKLDNGLIDCDVSPADRARYACGGINFIFFVQVRDSSNANIVVVEFRVEDRIYDIDVRYDSVVLKESQTATGTTYAAASKTAIEMKNILKVSPIFSVNTIVP